MVLVSLPPRLKARPAAIPKIASQATITSQAFRAEKRPNLYRKVAKEISVSVAVA
jgi:hypothetical protein